MTVIISAISEKKDPVKTTIVMGNDSQTSWHDDNGVTTSDWEFSQKLREASEETGLQFSGVRPKGQEVFDAAKAFAQKNKRPPSIEEIREMTQGMEDTKKGKSLTMLYSVMNGGTPKIEKVRLFPKADFKIYPGMGFYRMGGSGRDESIEYLGINPEFNSLNINSSFPDIAAFVYNTIVSGASRDPGVNDNVQLGFMMQNKFVQLMHPQTGMEWPEFQRMVYENTGIDVLKGLDVSTPYGDKKARMDADEIKDVMDMFYFNTAGLLSSRGRHMDLEFAAKVLNDEAAIQVLEEKIDRVEETERMIYEARSALFTGSLKSLQEFNSDCLYRGFNQNLARILKTHKN